MRTKSKVPLLNLTILEPITGADLVRNAYVERSKLIEKKVEAESKDSSFYKS